MLNGHTRYDHRIISTEGFGMNLARPSGCIIQVLTRRGRAQPREFSGHFTSRPTFKTDAFRKLVVQYMYMLYFLYMLCVLL